MDNTIKTARLRKGLTQKELADAVGVSNSMLSRYECGTAEPTLKVLRAIAEQLDTSTAILLGEAAADPAPVSPSPVATEPKFNGGTYAVPMGDIPNSGPEFEAARNHGTDGAIEQAFGSSDVGTYMGDNKYKSARQLAGEKNGTFNPKKPSIEQAFAMAQGHIYERTCAEACALIMSLETGFEVIAHPAGETEFRNVQWEDYNGHIDFLLEVRSGKIIPNPNFYVGGPEKNWVIIPDAEDHWYIADSKTVMSPFGANWSQVDENGIPVGGLKNGVAPDNYYDQMQSYMAALNIDGAMLFGMCKADLTLNSYAQVFVPYNKEKAEELMDTAQEINTRSQNGDIPAVKECKNKELAITELARQFPVTDRKRKFPVLDADEWLPVTSRIEEIYKKINELDEEVEENTPESLKELIKAVEAEKKTLKEEAKLLLQSTIEVIGDAACGWFKDPDTGDIIKIELSRRPNMQEEPRNYIKRFYPDLYDELQREIPDVKVKMTKEYADRSRPAAVWKTR